MFSPGSVVEPVMSDRLNGVLALSSDQPPHPTKPSDNTVVAAGALRNAPVKARSRRMRRTGSDSGTGLRRAARSCTNRTKTQRAISNLQLLLPARGQTKQSPSSTRKRPGCAFWVGKCDGPVMGLLRLDDGASGHRISTRAC